MQVRNQKKLAQIKSAQEPSVLQKAFKKQVKKAVLRRQKDAESTAIHEDWDDDIPVVTSTVDPMEALRAKAEARQASYVAPVVKEREIQEPGLRTQAESTRRAFFRELRKVVEIADVILEVLDARDPDACRNRVLEDEVIAQGKKVVIILNKIDLVPRQVVQEWITHLRGDFPTVAFKSAKQAEFAAHGSAHSASYGMMHSTFGVLGADTLVQLLKNYARAGKGKMAISVGVIGYPNVGKSSLINSLKRSAAVKVGGTAGVTRQLQEVHLDATVKLIDSPGVVFAGQTNDAANVLRSSAKIEQVEDPVGVVESMMDRCPREALLEHFGIPNFSTVPDFLRTVSRQRGKLKRGGGADLPAAARCVIQEWSSGRLRYFTRAPVTTHATGAAEILTQFAPELNVGAFFADGRQRQSALAEDAHLFEATETVQVVPAVSPVDASGDVAMTGDTGTQAPPKFGIDLSTARQIKSKKQMKLRNERLLTGKRLFNANNPVMVKVKVKAARAAKTIMAKTNRLGKVKKIVVKK